MPPPLSQKPGTCVATSSSCVIWQGADLPCLRLCKGDTITEVIAHMAQQLCESSQGLVDVASLDFADLVDKLADRPGTLTQVLTLLLGKVSTLQELLVALGRDPDGDPTTDDAELVLPDCLQYRSEQSEWIETANVPGYLELLATRICELLLLTKAHVRQFTGISTRITAIERTLNRAGLGLAEPVVELRCLEELPTEYTLPAAIQRLETLLCALLAPLTSEELTDAQQALVGLGPRQFQLAMATLLFPEPLPVPVPVPAPITEPVTELPVEDPLTPLV